MIVDPKDDVVMARYLSEDVHLQCELSRSGGEVQWFKDGQEVEETGRVQLVSEGPYRRLVILHGREEDGGEYVCETDGDSVFFQLTVSGISTSPPIQMCASCQLTLFSTSSPRDHRLTRRIRA